MSSFEEIIEDYVAWYSTPYGRYAHELEMALVLRFLGEYERKKILDVGCGPGFYAELLSPVSQIVGIDSSKAMLKLARQRSSGFVLASAESLPFKEGVFDLVLSVLALCFVGDHDVALNEIRRAVKKDGRIVVAVLNKWSLYALQKIISSEFRRSIYSEARFFNILEIKRLGARRWDSTLFALPTMPDLMLRLFRKFEGVLSKLLKPFGAFLVYELESSERR